MNINLLAPTIYWLIFSLITVRLASNIMVSTKKVPQIVPFYAVGIIFSLNSSLIAAQVFDTSAWFVLEVSFLITMCWILINLRKKSK